MDRFLTNRALPALEFFMGVVSDIPTYVPFLVSEHSAKLIASPDRVHPRNMYPALVGSATLYLVSNVMFLSAELPVPPARSKPTLYLMAVHWGTMCTTPPTVELREATFRPVPSTENGVPSIIGDMLSVVMPYTAVL